MVNPAAGADAEQHAREEMAGMGAGVTRKVRHAARLLAAVAGALAGWLVARGRSRR